MAIQDQGVPTLLIIPLIQIFIVLLLFFALLKGQRDLAILALLVLGFTGGIWLWTRASLTGLTCEFHLDKTKLFPGEIFNLIIRADNRKSLPLWLQIIVPVSSLLNPAAGKKMLLKEGALLWYQRANFTWELTAERRGVYRIGPARILAGDLFAFFTKNKKSEAVQDILVYPRLVPIRTFALPRGDFFGIPGAQSPVPDPLYILGTRDYQPGRPAKYIHWKASARRDRLQEKVLEPTLQEKVLLVVDTSQFSRYNAEEEFERTLEKIASLAALLDRRGHALGLVTNGLVEGNNVARVPVARNHQQLPAILEILARLQMKPRLRLNDAVRSGLTTGWGLSGVCFFYKKDRTLGLMDAYFKRLKIPILFFVCQPRTNAVESRPGTGGNIYELDSMDVKERADT